MATFDFFSQPRGPNIDIRLFPVAASAGIDAGNAQATVPGAIVQGVNQGLQTVSNFQKIQAQQNEINQQPVENQIRQEQLEKMQLDNDVQALENQVIQANEDLFKRAKKAELESKLQTTLTQANDLKAQDDITKTLGSGDPLAAKGILSNPAYQGALLRNPKFAEQVIGSLVRKNLLTPEEQKGAFAALDFSKTMEYQHELDKVNAQARAKQLEAFNKTLEKANEGSLPYLKNSYGLKDTDFASKVETFPAGVKNFNDDGTLKTGPDNDLTQTYLTDPSLNGKFDVVIDGKRANIRIGSTDNKNIQDLQQAMVAAGLSAPRAASTPVAAPSATPNADRPFSNAFSAAGQPNSQIVNQRAQELLDRAQNDPQLMNRLVAKGMLKQELAAQAGPPTAAPVPNGAPIPGVTSPNTQAPQRATPTAAPRQIAEVKNILSPGAKRYVDTGVVSKVLNQPLLKGLDPLYQAVAAVESSGNIGAKGEGSSATGFFQLTDGAAQDVKVDKNVPSQNVKGGVAYLNKLLAQFGGNEMAALMAYNIGMGPVGDAIDQTTATDYESILFGLRYLKDRGHYPKVLTAKNLETVAKYPLKVLAYKEAFSALSYV